MLSEHFSIMQLQLQRSFVRFQISRSACVGSGSWIVENAVAPFRLSLSAMCIVLDPAFLAKLSLVCFCLAWCMELVTSTPRALRGLQREGTRREREGGGAQRGACMWWQRECPAWAERLCPLASTARRQAASGHGQVAVICCALRWGRALKKIGLTRVVN